MWLSGQSRRRRDRLGEAQAGFATIGGGKTGVYLDGERRAMAVYAPGGYQWTPAPGQEVLVLEAMKMENSVTTDYAGKVKQILVEVGENVATDTVLIEIEEGCGCRRHLC